ncbi:hypothetical protein [Ornithinimicrobium kibberense]|uniref:hypothetical protein n=1 Tax=Ornithinimicrobium kibberense TaxID=282060 RepID=UPI00361EBD4F
MPPGPRGGVEHLLHVYLVPVQRDDQPFLLAGHAVGHGDPQGGLDGRGDGGGQGGTHTAAHARQCLRPPAPRTTRRRAAAPSGT